MIYRNTIYNSIFNKNIRNKIVWKTQNEFCQSVVVEDLRLIFQTFENYTIHLLHLVFISFK